MKTTIDFATGLLLITPNTSVDSDVSLLKDRMSSAENSVSDLTIRMSEAENAIGELTPEGNHELYQQFAFYHSGDKRITLGDIDCGEWPGSGFFPVDWRFDEWGQNGLILHFDTWT